MNDKIYIKSGELGSRTTMPALGYDEEKGSELGYRADEEALYIGTKNGNKRLCGTKDMDEIYAKLNAINTSITSINTQISDINLQIEEIIARLETPTE